MHDDVAKFADQFTSKTSKCQALNTLIQYMIHKLHYTPKSPDLTRNKDTQDKLSASVPYQTLTTQVLLPTKPHLTNKQWI